jgi:hypothetical protein
MLDVRARSGGWLLARGRLRLLAAVPVAALIAYAFGPAVGSAAAQPPFPHHYRGTISGTFVERDSSDNGASTTTASWKITGLVLRRGRVIKSDSGWSTSYAVISGKVTYHQAETGSCSYALDKTLPLRTSLTVPRGAFALSQSLFNDHPTTAFGGMVIKYTYHVSETCQQTGGGPAQVAQREISLGEMFDPQEKRVKLGRRFAGHTSSHKTDQVGSSTTNWSWVLNPRP